MTDEPDDRDSPWKEALDRNLEQFLALLFPAVHEIIDWSRRWIALDAELQRVVRDAATGRRLADKLFQVWLEDGGEAWVLIHAEIQGQVDETLPERAYVYNYRIFDRYRRPVVSLVVLADDRRDWRPSHYERKLAGCRVTLEFPTVKLLDFADRVAELEATRNPFAIIVLAHLGSLRTRNDPAARLEWKHELVTGTLLAHGYPLQEIFELYRFIDWLLALPPELERELMRRVNNLEEGRKAMVYISHMERLIRQDLEDEARREGRQEGLQSAVLTVLRTRFGPVPDEIVTRVGAVTNLEAVSDLLTRALTVASLDQLFSRS